MKNFFNILRLAITDGKGDISHARIIAMIVAISASVFIWKLTLTGKLTELYFLYFLGYGVIHQNLNKCLDVISDIWGRCDGNAASYNKTTTITKEEEVNKVSEENGEQKN